MNEQKNEKRFAEIVFDHIVNGILSGSLEPNSRVVERKIAKDLGISHVPVREAMEKLEHDGWIERVPQKGSRIKDFNVKEIENLFQLRRIMECGAIEVMDLPVKGNNRKSLEESYTALMKAHGQGSVENAVNADTIFHQAIVACTNNEKLISYHKTVILQLQVAFPVFLFGALDLAFGNKLKYDELQLKSHKEIYSSIIAGNREQAISIMNDHLKSSVEGIKLMKDVQKRLEKGNIV